MRRRRTGAGAPVIDTVHGSGYRLWSTMIPRSLAARLFLAIAIVSGAALLPGVWLVQRALHVDALDRRLLLALVVVLSSAAVATMLIAQRVVKPVTTLREAADRMTAGDLDARVPVHGQDEIAALGLAFNTMADTVRANERLRRDMTNDVARELRTPLTNLRCHLEALQDRVATATPDTVSILLAEVLHLQHLVDDLSDLARADAGQLALSPEAVPLEAAVALLYQELAPRLASAGITLTALLPPDLPLLCADRARLTQVLRNLVDNAIAHTPAGGQIRISARTVTDLVDIEVSDTGTGIDPEHLPHLFERFYRTDPSRSRATGGAGLGLAIVRQLTLAHGGRVSVESTPGQGARFIVSWPPSTSN
jgi:two-component system sensor histidine kinase BaeS